MEKHGAAPMPCTSAGAGKISTEKDSALPTPCTSAGASKLSTPTMGHSSDPDTVGAVMGKRGIIVCPTNATLAEAAEMLVNGAHTAALVKNFDGPVMGMLTENDLVTAFAIGVGWEEQVGDWLVSGDARLPRGKLPAFTVSKSTPIVDAARQMLLQRGAPKYTHNASHHLLVKTPDDEICWILSALDVTRAFATLTSVSASEPALELLSSDVLEAMRTRVDAVMKPRADLPECPLSATLSQAFRAMYRTNDNCIAVVDDESDSDVDDVKVFKRVHGIITPRELLRAFFEGVPADTLVKDFFQGTHIPTEARTIAASADLVGAASLMTASNLHHLIVAEPETTQVAGILSCLDLACFVGRCE